MKIDRFEIFHYELPLATQIAVGLGKLATRNGMVIRIMDEAGRSGWGEIAPLPGFSRESLDDAAAELKALRSSVLKKDIPVGVEELAGNFERWMGRLSFRGSVRFGFESAVMNLIALERMTSLSRVLSDSPLQTVPVSALLAGDEENIERLIADSLECGYHTFKLKVGRRQAAKDIALTAMVRELAGDSAILRLDANRAWDIEAAQAFRKSVSRYCIAYIEEPVRNTILLQTLLAMGDAEPAIALDESLRAMSPSDIPAWRGIGAIVLKPTVLGLEKSILFARAAAKLGIPAVVSSSFETGVGMTTLIHLAAAIQSEGVAAGLGTSRFLGANLVAIPNIRKGSFFTDDISDIWNNIRYDLLDKESDT